jgi:hypothetical protein
MFEDMTAHNAIRLEASRGHVRRSPKLQLFKRITYSPLMGNAQVFLASFLGQECGFHPVPDLEFL